jgi:hypothetical protein
MHGSNQFVTKMQNLGTETKEMVQSMLRLIHVTTNDIMGNQRAKYSNARTDRCSVLAL